LSEQDGAGHEAKGPARHRGQRPRGARLFVAAYPPPALLDLCQERLAALELPRHRKTPREQIHLTLHFIGETPKQDMDAVLESVERSVTGLEPCTLTAEQLIVLPRHGPGRLIAAQTDTPPSLLELHRRLVQRLARSPRQQPAKGYLPHLTLCRFRSPTPFFLGTEESPLGETDPAQRKLPLEEVVVVRSILHPEGVEHRRIARFPLKRS
jgi:2'-5' RNA ligase